MTPSEPFQIFERAQAARRQAGPSCLVARIGAEIAAAAQSAGGTPEVKLASLMAAIEAAARSQIAGKPQ